MLHPKQLAAQAAKLCMPAIAITDRNALFGALEFSEIASSSGVQPIIGVNLSVEVLGNRDSYIESRSAVGRPLLDHLCLLCQSEQGWESLCKILSRAYLESKDKHGPALSALALEQAAAGGGLLCLSGGPEALSTQLAAQGRPEAARDRLRYLQSIFGNRLYIELQRCGHSSEDSAEEILVQAAYDFNIPLVATNDVCFLSEEQHEAHDVLLCIGEGRTIHEDQRNRVTKQQYLKTSAEMKALFSDIPEAIENTLHIARRCAFMVTKRPPILPKLVAGDDISPDDILRQKAKEGLHKRFVQSVESRVEKNECEALWRQYDERLQYELDVIIKMGFADYYLIVADFMQWTLRQSIPVGVRGSGATSIVAWCLDITHIDPVRFKLIFERFLNPERISLPDFDIDFCQEQRGDVIKYVIDKYGADRVAQIISFGKLQARAAVRDVGRALGLPYGLTDKMARLIGKTDALADALKGEPELQNLISRDSDAARVMHIAQQVEGLYRHASMHAAGVIIGDRALAELVPLYRDPSSDMPVTQFSYKDCEKIGLVKFDFLGLRTLTIIDRARKYILNTEGLDIDVIQLDFQDKDVFKMLSQADTMGVFQLESAGMRSLLYNLQPTQFEQLIALISLYRPGPMDSIPSYIARAKGREPITYDHPLLEAALSETYGIITYQEDVMLIARLIAGYSMGEADLLRRAMGKKVKSEMDEHYDKIIKGADERGIPQKIATTIWEKCEKFVGYGFNKGHAAAYAQISYQTAYLKYHYTPHFYAACMSADIHDVERLSRYRQELLQKGISVLPPDVNYSGADFKVERVNGQYAIRYALGALKDIGVKPVSLIESERLARGEFTSVENFFSRLPKGLVAKSMIERLISGGALDSLDGDRDKLIGNLGQLMSLAGEQSRAANLFDTAAVDMASGLRLTQVERRSSIDLLKDELDTIGFFWSGHPLDAIKNNLHQFGIGSLAKAKEAFENKKVSSMKVAVLVHAIQRRRSVKTQKPYAFVTISDPTDSIEIMVFSEQLVQYQDILQPQTLIICELGGQKNSDGEVRFQLDSAVSINQWLIKHGMFAEILTNEQFSPEMATILKKRLMLSQDSGIKVKMRLKIPECAVTLDLPGRTNLSFNDLLSLEQISGVSGVKFRALLSAVS